MSIWGRILRSRYWNPQVAWLGAKTAAGAIAALCILGVVVVIALPLISASMPHFSLHVLFLQLMLGTLITVPALAMSCPIAAGLTGVSLSRLNLSSHPWLTLVGLAIVVFPAVLLPLIQSILWAWNSLSDRGPRSLFDPASYEQLRFLLPMVLILSILSAWRVTSRALGIPMLDLPRWFKPVERVQRSLIL